jgi:hypothetical protein
MGISGKVKRELTIETVLERCTESDIFNAYMPWKWELNQVCISPFPRSKGGYEKNPSFLIGNKYGNLTFKDFSSGEAGDCFKFVNLMNGGNLSLNDVLRLLEERLFGGCLDTYEPRKLSISESNESGEVSKKNTLIQVVTRKFLKSELDWWNQYTVDESDLKREEIYSIKKAYLNKKLLNLADLRFGYYFAGTWKLYSPNSSKRKKWLTNTPLTYLDGKENIQNCETAWITKSKKEKIILSKLYNCVISTQNESISCFSPENVDFIKNNSKKQVVLYDADDTGVRSCQEITKRFNMGYCNVPRKYLEENIKDFGDVCAKYGIGEVEKILKNKQLI